MSYSMQWALIHATLKDIVDAENGGKKPIAFVSWWSWIPDPTHPLFYCKWQHQILGLGGMEAKSLENLKAWSV